MSGYYSTVFGHFHSFAGIQYLSSTEMGTHFGMNVGCLIDQTQYAFKYGAKLKQRPVLGCGVVVKGVPHFIPMRVGKGNRWDGNVFV